MWGDEPFSWSQVDAWVGIVTAIATTATLTWAVVVAVQAENRLRNDPRRRRHGDVSLEDCGFSSAR